MRRTIFLTVASLATVLALPPIHVNASCTPPAPADSSAGLRTMRATQFIVWGTIDGSTVPADAHAVHSFFLKVRGYFRGAGPARIEVSDYGDGDLPVEAGKPGASIDASRQFIARFAGQDSIVFASHEAVPYTREFSTNVCTYTATGDAASSDILPLLRRVFGAPQPPNLAQTGPASVVGLMVAASALLAAGGALRAGPRLRRSLGIPPLPR